MDVVVGLPLIQRKNNAIFVVVALDWIEHISRRLFGCMEYLVL